MDFHEKLGALTAKAEAAHGRLDKLEVDLRSDLVEIQRDLKELTAYMHRGKGWAGALMLVSGIIGAAISTLLNR